MGSKKPWRLVPLAALLLAAAAAAQGRQIYVGKNYHVSGDEPDAAHTELLVAADPNDPTRLVGVSMIMSPRHSKIFSAVYASRDGGRTWRQTLSMRDAWPQSADPSCAFGPDGTAYFCTTVYNFQEGNPAATVLPFLFFRSRDGGFTWSEPIHLTKTGVSDRDYIAVDNGDGPRRGRVYVAGQISGKNLDGASTGLLMTLFRSRDGGVSFDLPAQIGRDKETASYHPGNNVVLSDGTVLTSVTEFRPPPGMHWENNRVRYEKGQPDALIRVLASRDGGDSLEAAATVGDASIPMWDSSLSTMPSLAADTRGGHFKDRAYVVWASSSSGRSEIYFAYSADKGRTWSKPKTINDDRPWQPPREGPDNYLPAVAVNREGVVGVMWYDRRESPDNLGWTVRFSASLDGGETFLPSVRVSEAATSHAAGRWNLLGASGRRGQGPGAPLTLSLTLPGFLYSAGHTSALAASADGVFHPFWVDNRTGVHQIWTAGVTVSGDVTPGGSPELAALSDITAQVKLEISDITFDHRTGAASASARVKNISGGELRGPIKVRALSLRSELAGVAAIADADNGQTGPGAVWDFTPELSGNKLGPGGLSRAKRLSFRFSDLRPFRQQGNMKELLLSLDARVYGGTAPEAGGAR